MDSEEAFLQKQQIPCEDLGEIYQSAAKPVHWNLLGPYVFNFGRMSETNLNQILANMFPSPICERYDPVKETE